MRQRVLLLNLWRNRMHNTYLQCLQPQTSLLLPLKPALSFFRFHIWIHVLWGNGKNLMNIQKSLRSQVEDTFLLRHVLVKLRACWRKFSPQVDMVWCLSCKNGWASFFFISLGKYLEWRRLKVSCHFALLPLFFECRKRLSASP